MQSVDPNRIPIHVGIIMDGNGRWAKRQGLPRSAGHKEGLTSAKNVVRAASEIGIRYLTLFTFSTENWKRAREEVSFLMHLIRLHLRKETDFYRQNGIRIVHSGDMARLPKGIQKEIKTVMEDTQAFPGMTLNLAINYGGRDEIVRSVNRWLEMRANGNTLLPVLTEQELRDSLDCAELPDPDLIIRTAGEQRVSNFLLWQSAYAELVFSQKLWPDFGPDDLYDAVATFQKRTRKYGAVPDELGGHT
ncbi:MAG TPA: polyprenyl diphosphate synthase [Spirochaetia bacterium]|nr:polyprenyl diphosphate synthase [Spirochaetia bacterium]